MAALSVIATARSWAHGVTKGGAVRQRAQLEDPGVKDAITSTAFIYLMKLSTRETYHIIY